MLLTPTRYFIMKLEKEEPSHNKDNNVDDCVYNKSDTHDNSVSPFYIYMNSINPYKKQWTEHLIKQVY